MLRYNRSARWGQGGNVPERGRVLKLREEGWVGWDDAGKPDGCGKAGTLTLLTRRLCFACDVQGAGVR